MVQPGMSRMFMASRSAVTDLGLAEDVFVEVGRTLRAEGDRSGWIAGRLWRPERVQRALSVWAEDVRPLAGSMKDRHDPDNLFRLNHNIWPSTIGTGAGIPKPAGTRR
jgi:hypothetical protein